MRRIGIGRSAEVFTNDEGIAIKLFYEKIPNEQIEYEVGIGQKISGVCTRAPKLIGKCEFENRVGIKYELINGVIVAERMQCKPLSIFKLVSYIGRVHREIHELSIQGLNSMDDKFTDIINHSNIINESQKRFIIEILKTNGSVSLCHGDFHPENIMLDKNGQIRVVDWVTSYSGNPLSDVARTYYLLRSGTSPIYKPLVVRIAEYILKPLIAKRYLKSYFHNKRIPKNDLKMWFLIIQIVRLSECIKEEQKNLERAIQRGLKELKQAPQKKKVSVGSVQRRRACKTLSEIERKNHRASYAEKTR